MKGAKTTCDGCGQSLAKVQTHYLELSHGWVMVRRAGGANAVKLATYTGKVLCEWCLLEAEKGEQQSLF